MGKKGKRLKSGGGGPKKGNRGGRGGSKAPSGPVVVSSLDFAAVLAKEREAAAAKRGGARGRGRGRGGGMTAARGGRGGRGERGGRGGRGGGGGDARDGKKAAGGKKKKAVVPEAPRAQMGHLGPRLRSVGLYKAAHHVLVVGDGDLSFALALAASMGGKNIVGTVYDSRTALREKYPATSEANITTLRSLQVAFRVDATDMAASEVVALNAPYDRIVFNFPHTGSPGSTQASVATNQRLLRGFFRSASSLLLEDGEAHVALRLTEFYRRWDVVECAKKAAMSLVRKTPFDASQYPGYECVRTASAELMRGAPTTDGAFTFCFADDDDLDPEESDEEEEEEEEEEAEPAPAVPSKRKRSRSQAGGGNASKRRKSRD